ncbi:MAG: Uma2 family endonuclease [Crocosphaera sp.]|nr:Uma2 family endonuclease [Crocosphaera sp.]
MTVIPYKWTIERYHRGIEAGIFGDESLELLQGDIVIMPPEREPHAYYNSEIGDYLRGLLGDRAKIREAHPITLNNNSEPVPDIAIVKPLGTIYRHRHPSAEDIFWLIEISNTTISQDLNKKKLMYAEAGIKEYWVINLNQLELIVFSSLEKKEYNSIKTYTSGTVSPCVFSDVNIPVKYLINP